MAQASGTAGTAGVNPGVISRMVARTREMISGVKPADQYSPNQPLPPFTPELVGRGWDFWVGYNLNTSPRDRHRWRFHDLRNFSNASDLVRLLIETRKDQMEAMPWNIKPREGKQIPQARLDQITDFFQYPDGENTWHQWLRALLEDVFVLDAAAIYRWRNRAGKLLSLDLIDGAMITLKIDSQGRRPAPPDVAYQQIIQGTPAVDYNADELLYQVHNRRTNSPYGFSPIEQIITTLQIISRRQESQQMYFESGTLPLASMEMPKEGINEEQFRNYMAALNARLEGNLRERSKIVPILSGSEIKEIKQPPLVGKEEEWFARMACFAFKVSPQPFVSMMNRATAETAKQQAMQEGLGPMLLVVKHLIDRIIREDFGLADAEFAWVDDREQDPLTQAQVDTMYVKTGIRSINQVRATLGDDPIKDELYDMPMPLTATGFVPLELSTEPPPDPMQPEGNKPGDQDKSPQRHEQGEEDKPQETSKVIYSRLRKGQRRFVPTAPNTAGDVKALKKKSPKYLKPHHFT